MKIAIVGYGFVGKSTELLFSDCECLIHDPDQGYVIDNWSGIEYTFICVPTPLNSVTGDSLSRSVVKEAISTVRGKTSASNRGGKIVVRSTLGPDQLQDDWIYMPEFLREGHWKEDTNNYKNPVIIGVDDSEDYHNLVQFLPFMKECYQLTPKEAAIYKMSRNALLAAKVMFANHLYDVCENNDSDYNNIKKLYVILNEFGWSHWDVPGPDGKRGFGGKCLPKDTTHFANLISDQNMFTQILEDNDITR